MEQQIPAQVYLLFDDYGYEGDCLIGCYPSHAAAMYAACTATLTHTYPDDYAIYPVTVGDTYNSDNTERFTLTPDEAASYVIKHTP